MKYQIEKNIPFPTSKGTFTKYPLREMEVGDSFIITDEKDAKNARTMASYVTRTSAGKKFATRTCKEGVRIWRTA